MAKVVVTLVAGAALVMTAIAPRSASAQTPIQLPPIDVIATTPLSTAPGAGGPIDITSIDRDKVPANTQTLTPQDFNPAKPTTCPASLLHPFPTWSTMNIPVIPFSPAVNNLALFLPPTS